MQDVCAEGCAMMHGRACNECAEGWGKGRQVMSQDNKRGLS